MPISPAVSGHDHSGFFLSARDAGFQVVLYRRFTPAIHFITCAARSPEHSTVALAPRLISDHKPSFLLR
jgi:hypothetical protein